MSPHDFFLREDPFAPRLRIRRRHPFLCLPSMVARLVALVCMIVCVGRADAHETWIAVGAPRAGPPGGALVAITNGTRFPEPESGLSAGSLAQSGVDAQGERRSLVPVASLPRILVARAPLPASGIATIWLALDPQPITLDDALVPVYFDEIQADDSIRKRWAADRESDRSRGWHEDFAKFAKSIVRSGPSDAADDGWSRPVGGVLEVVPERDPTAMRGGDVLPVRLLLHGAPVGGQMLALTDGTTKTWQRTDADGRASFVLPGAGPWLIHGTVLRRSGDRWASWFTTLTFRSAETPADG